MTPRDKFLMVDELASLVKKKDDSKCLILSVEDVLVEYLEGDTSLGGVIELIPMSPFHRMLVHRLADIFGFSHHSVGEGANKHVVLERTKETSVPDTLLSRMLWKTRKWEIKQSPTTYNVLMRKGVSPGQKVDGCAHDQADEGEKLALTSSDTTSNDTTSNDTTASDTTSNDAASSDTTSCDARDQVYELVDIIKNNHSGKSLVLSVEELLVDYLEKDKKSSDGLLELLPMDNFQRMLVHRLAHIFRFSSHSVGEGKDRHVVLERCSETSIPDLLVSRLLWKTRKMETLQPPMPCDVLLRKEVSPEKDPMLGDRTTPSVLGRADKAKTDHTNDETDTNPSKKMKMSLTMACTTMPEEGSKYGEEIPTVDGRSREAVRKNDSNPLAELKNDTPDDFLKL